MLTAALISSGPATADGGGGSSNTVEPAASGNTSVSAVQAQVAAIEAQIAQQQQQLTTLSEQFDRSTVHLRQVQTQLAQIRVRLAADKEHYRAAHRQLQEDAVKAYVDDVPATELSTMFSSASDRGALRKEYRDTAIGNIDAAVAAVRSDEHALSVTEGKLHEEVQAAASETASVQSSEQAAQNATAAAEATLSSVKGRLAQMIAQQAAEQAARQAAAAAAAATKAARQRAARKAAEDAQVAQAVGSGSAAAAAATAAANWAAGAAGQTGVVGTGSPQEPHGAGSVALTAAESYLGVPYDYGGAGPGGLDCSGLTMLAWQAAGVSLDPFGGRSARPIEPRSPLGQVQPGDLLFYDLGGGGIDHVVMYVGSGPYGADTIIQAAHTGTVVEFDPIWYFGLVGAGRP